MAHVLADSSSKIGSGLESSDSDEEINTTVRGPSGAVIVAGEAPESDEEFDDDDYDDQRSPPPPPTPSRGPRSLGSDCGDEAIHYNSLLHKKLREKNEQLRKELSDLACHPYNSATKEITHITNQLVKSQKMVQGISATLRKVSKELFMLEDTIEAVRIDKNFRGSFKTDSPAKNRKESQRIYEENGSDSDLTPSIDSSSTVETTSKPIKSESSTKDEIVTK